MGGAPDLAHIGVLQWFEEHRIPIGCLPGMSMRGRRAELFFIPPIGALPKHPPPPFL